MKQTTEKTARMSMQSVRAPTPVEPTSSIIVHASRPVANDSNILQPKPPQPSISLHFRALHARGITDLPLPVCAIASPKIVSRVSTKAVALFRTKLCTVPFWCIAYVCQHTYFVPWRSLSSERCATSGTEVQCNLQVTHTHLYHTCGCDDTEFPYMPYYYYQY
eukprot:1354423-Rhodomonas_salina.1